MPFYTREELDAMNAKAMKRMAFNDLGLVGLSKKPKEDVIKAILIHQAQTSDAPAAVAPAAPTAQPLNTLQGSFTSVLSKPNAPFGNKMTTTIQVSSGANSGSFEVVGRKVSEVAEFLREVLNVDRMANAVVNGAEVSGSYVIKSGDILEFMKPAGKKGC
jgi:hypothetical protein